MSLLLMVFYITLPLLMLFPDLLRYIFSKVKLRLLLSFKNSKQRLSYNVIPKLKAYKLTGEGNLDPWHIFWPAVISNTDLYALTPIIKLEWLKKNIGMLWNLVSLCCIMLLYLGNFGILPYNCFYLINKLPTVSLNFTIPYQVFSTNYQTITFSKLLDCLFSLAQTLQ